MDKGKIILYQPDNSIQLEVRMEEDTVWLTQQQMALLFDTTKQNISLHVNNIFKEGELKKESVVKFFLTTAKDGKNYRVWYYNLDVIISVGYRVKSVRGTEFRIWANSVLKDYLLKKITMNQRISQIENQLALHEKVLTDHSEKIDFFVRTSLPPVEGIFYNGQVFDAYTFATDLIKSAKRRIILIDNYIDESVLLMLSKREEGVSAEIITRRVTETLRLDLERHQQQYPPIAMRESSNFHDRFLIIDDTVYHLGASLKDLGKKLFAFSRMEMPVNQLGVVK